MPTKMHSLYTGMSGQFAAMSEFLVLGYNVAIPEVDRGDDVFVVRDIDGDLSRIQVKTANAQSTNYGYRATVNVPKLQLETPRRPELFYNDPVRHDNRWKDFLVISRKDLRPILQFVRRMRRCLAHYTSAAGVAKRRGDLNPCSARIDSLSLFCEVR